MESNVLNPDSTQELTVIDKSIEVFKGGSQILRENKARSEKALLVGKDILDQWEKAYAIEDEEKRRAALAEVDARSNKFLVNCGAAKKAMEDSRKAITQLMDLIKSMYTESENAIDPKKGEVPAKVQVKRNEFAKDELAYQERKRKEAEARAAKASEEAELRSAIKKAIAQKLITYLSDKKQKMTVAFNAITLSDFEVKSQKLKQMSCVFPVGDLDILLENCYGLPLYKLHAPHELLSLIDNERHSYDFPAFYKQYLQEVTELKQSLIDRLPSKKAELDEEKRLADEAEKRRKAAEQAAAEAEKKRQAEIAAAKSASEKKRKEREAEEARKAEADRLAKLAKDEEDRKAAATAEQKRREQEEADKIAAETAAAEKKVQNDADLAEAATKAAVLFEQTEASAGGTTPETRNGYIITVMHPAGWVELFQFWFTREANKLGIEEMGKKSLNQIKAYAEKAAKGGDKIQSKHLVYETDTKAVNRREK